MPNTLYSMSLTALVGSIVASCVSLLSSLMYDYALGKEVLIFNLYLLLASTVLVGLYVAFASSEEEKEQEA